MPSERARCALDERVLDLAENLGFADQHRVEAGADAEEMIDRLAPEQRVHVGVHVLDAAVAEVAEELADLLDAFFVVFELGVDLEPAAGLQHQRFADRFVVAQRDQRFAHLVRRKRVALADVDRRGVVGEPHADERHELDASSRGAANTRRQGVIGQSRACGRRRRAWCAVERKPASNCEGAR